MNRSLLSLLSAAAVLTACTSTAISTQPMLNAQGQPIGSMELTFRSNGWSEAQDVVAISSDGERFDGQVIGHKMTHDEAVTRTEHYSKREKKKRREQGLDTTPYSVTQMQTVTSYSSEAEAMLIGNRGHSMRCQFTMNAPSWGMAWEGGIGECRISDGRTVPVVVRRDGNVVQ